MAIFAFDFELIEQLFYSTELYVYVSAGTKVRVCSSAGTKVRVCSSTGTEVHSSTGVDQLVLGVDLVSTSSVFRYYFFSEEDPLVSFFIVLEGNLTGRTSVS